MTETQARYRSNRAAIKAWIKRMRDSWKGDRSEWAGGYKRALDNLETFLETGEDP